MGAVCLTSVYLQGTEANRRMNPTVQQAAYSIAMDSRVTRVPKPVTIP
jgi:hypothetical protein